MRIKTIGLLAVSATLSLSACGGGQLSPGEQQIVERVPGDRPDWAFRPPRDDDGFTFFVGLKTHASSLDNGNTDARQNAIQKIVEWIGGTGRVDYTKARVEAGLTDEDDAGNYIEDGYRFVAESIARGMREQESYYEHVKQMGPGGRLTYHYNYYVLFRIELSELANAQSGALDRAADEARAANNAAAVRLAEQMKTQLTQDASGP